MLPNSVAFLRFDILSRPQADCSPSFAQDDTRNLPQQHTDDRGGDQVGHGAGEHGAHAESARSLRRSGTSAPMPPICMPMEPRLAKPHSAKVAMVKERGSSVRLLRAQADVGDDFIERHARAEQVADGAGARATARR